MFNKLWVSLSTPLCKETKMKIPEAQGKLDRLPILNLHISLNYTHTQECILIGKNFKQYSKDPSFVSHPNPIYSSVG